MSDPAVGIVCLVLNVAFCAGLHYWGEAPIWACILLYEILVNGDRLRRIREKIK